MDDLIDPATELDSLAGDAPIILYCYETATMIVLYFDGRQWHIEQLKSFDGPRLMFEY